VLRFSHTSSCFLTEFDGGDGQMGVAGDGKKGLQNEWDGAAKMAKSKTMSAKNAWGKTTGYAEQLISEGVEQSRAQQLENWMAQQEVLTARKAQRAMTEDFDNAEDNPDEDWRKLAKFGVERNQVSHVLQYRFVLFCFVLEKPRSSTSQLSCLGF
jgi:hypothetical protein